MVQYDAIKPPPPDPNMSQSDDGALLAFSGWMSELVEPVYEGILKVRIPWFALDGDRL